MKKLLIFIFALLFAIGCTADVEGPNEPAATVAETVEVPDPTETAVTPVATVVEDPAIVLTPERLAATVQTLEVGIETSEVVVVVNGSLKDGCTEIAQIEQSVSDTTLSATILTERDPNAVCTLATVPFEEIIRFDRTQSMSGRYTVDVNGVTEMFAVLDDSATISVQIEGETAAVVGSNFPADQSVNIAVALPNSEYVPSLTIETADNGTFDTAVSLEALEPDRSYLIVASVDGQEVLSDPFTVQENQPAEFSSANLYFVMLEDAGQSGEEIGCGDSIIPVEVSFSSTPAPLSAAFESLLAVDEQYYDNHLYNALYGADLQLAAASVIDGVATVELVGDFAIGGVCDGPRVEAQLRQTAAQFSTVDEVEILINGETVESLLNASG